MRTTVVKVAGMELNETTIRELINLTDEVGVISVYVGITPDRAGDPKPGWPIEIRNQLRSLVERAKEERGHEAWSALSARLEELDRDLERLLDASRHGRGRALFATVTDGRLVTTSMQIPFEDRAVLDRNPYVRPLVAALDEGRSAGIVALAKRGIRVLEWRLGEAEELERGEFTIGGRLWRQKSGPAPAQPQDTRHGGQRRDEFEERVDENRLRFVRERAREVAEFANDRGWDRLIVAGDPRLTKPFADELNPAPGEQLQVTDLSWEDDAPNVVADQAWEEFKVLRRERAHELTDRARDLALSGGAGALGLSEVVASLNEGRVDHLLIDETVQHAGYISGDGLLYADDQRPAAQGGDLRDEPLLVERMIERALETGARVTPIDEDAEAGLAESDGVAAILRW
jgi:hypothetical protein